MAPIEGSDETEATPNPTKQKKGAKKRKTSYKVLARRMKIIRLLATLEVDGAMSISVITGHLGLSWDTVDREMRALRKLGFVEKVDTQKNSRYRLNL